MELQEPVEKVRAPELDGAVGWLNVAQPIHLKDLRGKVVLLDFWTFCCINCMHVIPDLKRLEEKYKDNLVVIGIHSAKFNNEKDTTNIKGAILRYDVTHPVANDANFKIWNAYGVHSWPTLVLIDPDGNIFGTVSGEGQGDTLDKSIAQLIAKNRAHLKAGPIPNLVAEYRKQFQHDVYFPGKVIADTKSHQLFISDSGHNRIAVADPGGKILQSIGCGAFGYKDGSFAQAMFRHPQGLAYRDGKLYVADTESHAIRLIDFAAKTVTTVAGTGKQASFGAAGGPAKTTALNSPWDIVFAGDRLYIAMAGAHQVWVMDLKAGTVKPFAGSGTENIIDGPAQNAALAQPSGITSDGTHLYTVDSEVSAVRSIDLATGAVSTIVGKGLFDFGDKDGKGAQVRLQHPLGISYADGKLYVADSYNHKVKVIDPKTKSSTTLLGGFKEPGGLYVAGNTLYVADTNNQRVVSVDLKTKKINDLIGSSAYNIR